MVPAQLMTVKHQHEWSA